MTKSQRSRLGVGALMIGIPASAAAIAAGQALASPAPEPPHVNPKSHHVDYGQEFTVRGTALSSDAGHTLVLEFAPRGTAAWRQLGWTVVDSSGEFRLGRPLEQSGAVRVLDSSSGSVQPFVADGGNDHAATTSPVPVDVAARVRVASHEISVLGGQAVKVRGRLLPGVRGRKVSLETLRDGAWHTIATARTGSAGRFGLRYVAVSQGQAPLRVRFSGDRRNERSTARAGRMTVYRAAGASWYYDAGNTACGFHAQHGVANRTLPCDTKVAFRYGGRSVTATVDDRGPYVGGRDWDLSESTAGALGFGGVGQVWSSR